MSGTFLERKLNILTTPLPELTFSQRSFLKFFLLFTEHLVTVEHQNNLSLTPDPLIFAFNHNSSFEALLVPIYLIYCRRGCKISFVIDWMFGMIPILGWILKQSDPIYVYHKKSTILLLNSIRNKPSQTVDQQCIERLAKKSSIGIFPEGTRNQTPIQLLKGRKGIGHIALESQVPVLPVGIDFPLRQTQGKIPKLGRVILRIGEPLRFQTEIEIYQKAVLDSNLPPNEFKTLTRNLTSTITHKVMIELEKLSGKKYSFPTPMFTIPTETFE